jgi:CRISPR-associated endonuclease Csn1
MKNYVLGIDLGANSVGWAMVAEEPSPDTENIISGVRVFTEGTDKTGTNKEESRNKARREARQARRQHDRRSRRKIMVKRILQRRGLFPLIPEEQKELFKMNPYELRKKGLDEELTEYEFARCLIHINQRRGFKSSLKGSAEAKKEASKVVEPAIAQLESDIKNSGARTLGEYFYTLFANIQRVREHYTRRSMFENEFDQLWTKQASFKPKIWTDEFKKEIKEAIFFQRALKSQKELIGKCPLESEEKRCPRASWFAHQFRILQEINNLRVVVPLSGSRRLTTEERASLIKKLLRIKEVKVEDIRNKYLKLQDREFMTFERSQRKSIKGNPVEYGLRKIFGKEFDAHAPQLRGEVYESLINEEDEVFLAKAATQWNLTEEQIKAISEIDQTEGYMRFSLKAIKHLIPHLEQGKELHDAIKKEYPQGLESRQSDFIPSIKADEIRNPIVSRALSEARKVVNAIIRKYGKPSRIRIELARETKKTIRQRVDETKENRKRNERHEEIKETLNEHDIPPNHDNIEKYKLWEECDHQCPYTGRPINFPHDLYGDNCQFDVEHIWPYSRSLDNSFMNKTLCARSENMRKHNKTPKEAYSGDEYLKIVNRIKNFPDEKKRRFYQDMPADFSERQIRDTSYIATEVGRILKTLGISVESTRGPITAELRYRWGLNSILNPKGEEYKSRLDHRHHAIDAIVIALTTRSHVKNLSSIYDFAVKRPHFPCPLEPYSLDAFRSLVQSAIDRINVSWRPERKVSGQITEETNYGIRQDGTFVHRVPLQSITENQIEHIYDRRIRELVEERLRTSGLKPKQAFDSEKKPLYLPSRKSTDGRGPIIKSVRVWEKASNFIPLKDIEGKIYRYVAPGENHHISIFEWEEGGVKKRDGVVVSRFEVLQRVQRNKKRRAAGEPLEPVITKIHPEHPEARFIFYLCKKDMFMLEEETDDGQKREILCRVQKFDVNNNITLFDAQFAGRVSGDEEIKISDYRYLKVPNTLKGRKVNVDPLGRITEAHD